MKAVLITLCLVITIAAGAQQVTTAKTYICPPCGCNDDHRTFDAPGTCPSCNMTLLNKDNLDEGLDYYNIYPDDVCDRVSANPQVLLLDVRSLGEWDGSTSDLGRFKNAKHIPIADIESRANELAGKENDEIIVYCSISARSARVSKYLSENGFNNVKNMMGGLTLWNRLTIDSLQCKNELLIKPN